MDSFELERCCDCETRLNHEFADLPSPLKFVRTRGDAKDKADTRTDGGNLNRFKELHRYQKSYRKTTGQMLVCEECATWSGEVEARRQSVNEVAKLILRFGAFL